MRADTKTIPLWSKIMSPMKHHLHFKNHKECDIKVDEKKKFDVDFFTKSEILKLLFTKAQKK